MPCRPSILVSTLALTLAIAALPCVAPARGAHPEGGLAAPPGDHALVERSAPPAARQDRKPADGARAAAPSEAEIVAAFERGDYAGALALIAKALVVTPNDPLLHYNAACALALLDRPEDAAKELQKAVRCGFRDFQHMERDEDLASLRSHPVYQEILRDRDRADRDAGKAEVERWRERFGDKRYRYEHDPFLNVHFATSLDPRMHQRMVKMLRDQAERQIAMLFAGPPRESVFVAIPTREDARVFFRELARRDATFDSPNVAGIYEHRPRRLVSTDIGASLRHEFTHAMHYGDMERLGQAHPLWLQEGLATLFEDYDYAEDGALVFRPNDRTEVALELVREDKALPWRKMLAIGAEDFMKYPQVFYPQVRSMFRFLADKGKLEAWYKAYTRSFRQDPTSAKAFEEVFDAPLPEVERQWRSWVLGQPAPDTTVRPGDASLGVAVEDAIDGARIVRVIAGSAAARMGLRPGDVIVAINGATVSAAAELVAAIAGKSVGDRVSVLLRRGDEYLELSVRLQALAG